MLKKITAFWKSMWRVSSATLLCRRCGHPENEHWEMFGILFNTKGCDHSSYVGGLGNDVGSKKFCYCKGFK